MTNISNLSEKVFLIDFLLISVRPSSATNGQFNQIDVHVIIYSYLHTVYVQKYGGSHNHMLCIVYVASNATISCSGIPHNPKPPTPMNMLLVTMPSSASFALE